jgi:predicted metal-dependent phosphoesterase TrpH
MIDLHTHTNCSDGTDSPRELVNKAIVQGLEVLGIADHDKVSLSNLHRQILFGTDDIGLFKVDVVKRKMFSL